MTDVGQGGGEVLAFATRPQAPPAKETLLLLAGVIAGGALIRQTRPASSLQVSRQAFELRLDREARLVASASSNEATSTDSMSHRSKSAPWPPV